MPPIDPPYRLDPYQNIVNVGWGNSAVAVLFFNYIVTFTGLTGGTVNDWTARFTDDTDDPTLRRLALLDELGPVVTPPGPPSKTPPRPVIPNNNFWCYPRRFASDVETHTATIHFVDRGKYFIHTDAGTITSHIDPIFGIQVPFVIETRPGNTDLTPTDLHVINIGEPEGAHNLRPYMLDVVGHVFTPQPDNIFQQLSEEIEGHDITTSVDEHTKTGSTATFLNLSRIAAKNPSVKAAGEVKIVAQIDGSEGLEFQQWQYNCFTFNKGKGKKFAVDYDEVFTSDGMKQILPNVNVTNFHQEISAPLAEGHRPLVEVTYRINLATYGITASRRNLT